MLAERRRLWTLVGIVALAFAARVLGLDFQSLWRDEVDAILFATEPLAGLVHTFVEPGQNGPLYYLVLRFWLMAAGHSEFALRFFSVVFGVLTVPLIHRLGRRLFSPLPGVAVLAALLAAASPYLVWYGQEGKMYALLTFLIVLSMERYLAVLAEGGWQRWLIYAVVTSLAFYVHLLAALIIPAQVLVFLIADRQTGVRRWKPWLACMAALTVPYLPLSVWQLPLLLERTQTGYRFLPLHQMLFSLLSSYSLGVLQAPEPWALAVFLGLLLVVGVALVTRGPQRRSVWILTCWLLVPVFGLFGLTLVRPMYTARYLIFVLPAYLLLLASAVLAVGRPSRPVAAVLLVSLLAVSGWGIWLQARTPFKADFRNATRYVAAAFEQEDLILFQIPHGRYSFDYYFHLSARPVALPEVSDGFRVFLPWAMGGGADPYQWAEGPYTNAGMLQAELSSRMAELTKGHRIVWLIATEVPMWDERNLVQEWLEEHARLTDEAKFVRVEVYRYEFP